MLQLAFGGISRGLSGARPAADLTVHVESRLDPRGQVQNRIHGLFVIFPPTVFQKLHAGWNEKENLHCSAETVFLLYDSQREKDGTVESATKIATYDPGLCRFTICRPSNNSRITLTDYSYSFFATNCFEIAFFQLQFCPLDKRDSDSRADNCFFHEIERSNISTLANLPGPSEEQSATFFIHPDNYIPPGNYSLQFRGAVALIFPTI